MRFYIRFMYLQSEILREHSKAQTNRIMAYIGDNPERFKELITLFLGDEYRVTQRAAWPLSYIAVAYPELSKPYEQKLLSKIKQPKIHDAIKRNTLRIWEKIMPEENLWGELFDICYSFLRSKDEPAAVKVFAMQVMCNIVLKHPELKFELQSAIQDLLLLGKPAILSRGRKILKQLERI